MRWIHSASRMRDLRKRRRPGKCCRSLCTETLAPTGLAAGSVWTASGSANSRVPSSSSEVRVRISTWATLAMLHSASPRNPRVRMLSRSSIERILLVEKRSTARRTSSRLIPHPSSDTRISSRPPSRTSIDTLIAPASMAFSISSLTTEAGRSITSPAAMRFLTWGESICMLKV